MEAYQNAALSPEERAKDLLGKMTLQEKVGQLNQQSVRIPDLRETG